MTTIIPLDLQKIYPAEFDEDLFCLLESMRDLLT